MRIDRAEATGYVLRDSFFCKACHTTKERSMRFRFRVCATVLLALFAGEPARLRSGKLFHLAVGHGRRQSGAVIPGADVKIKNNGTGAEFNAVSGSDGGFTVNGLPAAPIP